jgi:crossover junction endodeoxyribonuclease RusA
MTITVYGVPAPQGSKRHVGNGVMIESSKKVKPWREAVKYAALDAPECFMGPVHVDVLFTLPRPKSAKAGAMACKRPDLDKLIRSTGDALTDAGAYEDDAKIVSLSAGKLYVGDKGALRVPGAIIRITSAVQA